MGSTGKKRKLAPWEKERRQKRLIVQKEERERLKRAGFKVRNLSESMIFGRRLAPKKENKHFMEEQASFACPNCGNDKKKLLLRRRPGFYECLAPKCPDKFFVRDEALDVDEWEIES